MQIRLDTIIIFVRDIEKLKPLYVDMLQLDIVEETAGEWLLLQSGACKIGLHKIPTQYLKDGATGNFDTNTKIVFEIEEDIYQLREYLISKNVAMTAIKTFDNYGFILCDGTDAEGNVFQLKQRQAQHQ